MYANFSISIIGDLSITPYAPEQSAVHMGQHVDKIMSKSKENFGHNLKILSIDHNKAFHSIPLQILSHFDENNIAVAKKLTKWYNL